MTRFAKATSAVLAAAVLTIPAAAAGTSQRAVTSTDWPAYEHGSYHRSTSYGDPAITTTTAATLHPAWTFTAARSTAAGAPAPSFDASPVVANGVAYIGSRSGIFAAIRVSNGSLLWRRQLDYGQASQCPARGTIATANVIADPVTHALTVYAPGSHYLYALNPQTGAVKWKTAIGPATTDGEQHWYNWSSPTVVGGKIYMGLGSDCDTVKIRAGEVQLDQHSGKLLHSWYDVPAGVVGGTVWSSSASDGKSVWVSTGNPASSASQVYDAYSIVRLDATTFTKQDKWTGSFPLGADLDFGSSPTLFVANLHGTATTMVGACNKNGVYYAWRAAALAAGPVWQVQVGIDGTTMTGACITSAAFDLAGNAMFVGANNLTTDGKIVNGVVRELDPATGAAAWTTTLPCGIFGSPTLNGTTHVLAVPLYNCAGTAKPGVALLNATTGAVLKTITTAGGEFAQPVFAAGALFVADESGHLGKYLP
jgi:polyvinyl alcohol dehydrogenase (cytochrome)